MLPVALHGCETCLSVYEKNLDKVENTVLRRIIGPKKEQVTNGWAKLQ
jgi:hypothetical protein